MLSNTLSTQTYSIHILHVSLTYIKCIGNHRSIQINYLMIYRSHSHIYHSRSHIYHSHSHIYHSVTFTIHTVKFTIHAVKFTIHTATFTIHIVIFYIVVFPFTANTLEYHPCPMTIFRFDMFINMFSTT